MNLHKNPDTLSIKKRSAQELVEFADIDAQSKYLSKMNQILNFLEDIDLIRSNFSVNRTKLMHT